MALVAVAVDAPEAQPMGNPVGFFSCESVFDRRSDGPDLSAGDDHCSGTGVLSAVLVVGTDSAAGTVQGGRDGADRARGGDHPIKHVVRRIEFAGVQMAVAKNSVPAPLKEPWYRSMLTDHNGYFDTGRILVAVVIIGMLLLTWLDV